MTCSYCGCGVAEGAEYCFFCKAEQPLNRQQRKKYRLQILALAILLTVQLAAVILLGGALRNGRLAQIYLQIYLKNGNMNGFVRYVTRNKALQQDPDTNCALETYLQALNASLTNPQSGDIVTAASQYKALGLLSALLSNEPLGQTVCAYTQEFTEIQSAYENLEKVQTMDVETPRPYNETFSVLDAAYHTFDYSAQEYKELCEAVFSVYIEHTKESLCSNPEEISSETLNTLLTEYRMNEILCDVAIESANQIYELRITDALEEGAFQGPEGAVTQAVDYYAVKEFIALYGTELADKVHAKFQKHLGALLQAGEYTTIFTLLEDTPYDQFDEILQVNGESTPYYQELLATAVSLQIAQQMDVHCYLNAEHTGAVQIAYRYADLLLEDIDCESILQNAIAYEKDQLLQQINQKRRENGYNGLKNHDDMLAIANDYVLHWANNDSYPNDNDFFKPILSSYGYDPDTYGWSRVHAKAQTGLQCYTTGADSKQSWDWLESKKWLSDIGVGVCYHENDETFYWYIIAIG